MERAGEVVRLSRGLYQLPDVALDPHQSLAEAARLVPKGVICLVSALAFHGLTDQMPPKVRIAIGRKDWRPRASYPPLWVARFPDDQLRRGVEQKKIEGTSVPVFGVAKTVADLFRYALLPWPWLLFGMPAVMLRTVAAVGVRMLWRWSIRTKVDAALAEEARAAQPRPRLRRVK